MTPKCKICNSESYLFSNWKILNHYDVSYYRCPQCGFIQTEEPYWLDEAYSNAITNSDIGLVSRNYTLAQKVASILKLCFSKPSHCLDFGGGYGIFTRLMRDYGFNFEWYDKYCENLFAKGFEKKQEKYDVLTTFELFEHLSNPVEEFERLLDKSRVIICTTNLVPDPAPKVGDWWYYSPETGQHISFYTKSAMKILAGKFNLKYSGYGNLHIFAQSKINPSKLKFAYRGSFLINKFCRYNSFLPEDYKAITGQELK